MLSKLLRFLPKLRSGALATRLFVNKKCVVQIIRSKKNCRSGVNGLIKCFSLHTPRFLDSKNVCLWFLNRCSTFLKRHKQNVRINNTRSVFQILLSGVLQGSVLEPPWFEIFINDLYLWISKTDLLNFADENAIEKLISTLE